MQNSSPDEEWVDIRGFPNHLISNLGRVCNWQSGIILKPRPSGWGYLQVMLYRNGKTHTKSIHRMVAEEFIPGEDEGLEVNHKDGVKSHNTEFNLEWVTKGMNNLHAIQTGLRKPRGTPVMIVETGDCFKSVRDCADFLGTWATTVSAVLTGKQPSYKGLTFRRIE